MVLKDSFMLPKKDTDSIRPGKFWGWGVVAGINVAKQSAGGWGALPSQGHLSNLHTNPLSIPWVCQQQPLGRTRLETEAASISVACSLPLVSGC